MCWRQVSATGIEMCSTWFVISGDNLVKAEMMLEMYDVKLPLHGVYLPYK